MDNKFEEKRQFFLTSIKKEIVGRIYPLDGSYEDYKKKYRNVQIDLFHNDHPSDDGSPGFYRDL